MKPFKKPKILVFTETKIKKKRYTTSNFGFILPNRFHSQHFLFDIGLVKVLIVLKLENELASRSPAHTFGINSGLGI